MRRLLCRALPLMHSSSHCLLPLHIARPTQTQTMTSHAFFSVVLSTSLLSGRRLPGTIFRFLLSRPFPPQVFLSFVLLCGMLSTPVTATAAHPTTGTPAASAPGKPAVTLLVVGDSISAEYGLPRGTGWVNLLRRQIAKQYPESTVINASISGDTTAAGRSRLPALLRKHRPTHVVLELGANDALRGLPLKTTLQNLIVMSKDSRQAGARVLIAGMQMPPNYGAAYQKQFASVFERAARQSQAALLPFLLAGIADLPGKKSMSYFQQDRIHPSATAQPYIMRNVWHALHSSGLMAADVKKAKKDHKRP